MVRVADRQQISRPRSYSYIHQRLECVNWHTLQPSALCHTPHSRCTNNRRHPQVIGTWLAKEMLREFADLILSARPSPFRSSSKCQANFSLMQPVPAAASPYAPPASAAAAGGNAGFSDYSTEHEDHKEEMVRCMEQDGMNFVYL